DARRRRRRREPEERADRSAGTAALDIDVLGADHGHEDRFRVQPAQLGAGPPAGPVDLRLAGHGVAAETPDHGLAVVGAHAPSEWDRPQRISPGVDRGPALE